MSSYNAPHCMYLFELKNGLRKLAFGESPEDALDILKFRLSQEEMAEVIPDSYIRVPQSKLQEYLDKLG